MSAYYYIGLDIHKRTISYCIKAIDGTLIGQGKVDADRKSLGEWAKGLPGPGLERWKRLFSPAGFMIF